MVPFMGKSAAKGSNVDLTSLLDGPRRERGWTDLWVDWRGLGQLCGPAQVSLCFLKLS